MKYVLMALWMAIPIVAQEVKPEPKPNAPAITKFIELKYLSGDRLNRVVNFVSNVQRANVRLFNDPVLKTFVIQADTQANIAAAEEMIRRFDVPAAEEKIRQIQLTVYLLEPADDGAQTQRPPAELASAIEQLRNLFGHKSMRVVETTIMQGREGASFATDGVLGGTASEPAPLYTAKYKSASYSEGQKSVFVYGFSYVVRVPTGAGITTSRIESDLTIKDGQKLVLGKVTKGQNGPAGFLVVTAKVE